MTATEVAVLSTGTAGGPVGLTMNSFGSLSLDPPLVLWSLRRSAASLAAFSTADRFAVDVLAADQRRLAYQFASDVPDRFAVVLWAMTTTGCRSWPGLWAGSSAAGSVGSQNSWCATHRERDTPCPG